MVLHGDLKASGVTQDTSGVLTTHPKMPIPKHLDSTESRPPHDMSISDTILDSDILG